MNEKQSRNRSKGVKASDYNMIKISNLLYSTRKRFDNRTQGDMAKLLGFPPSIWSRHEQGDKIKLINLDFINKFCEYFGYNIEDVLVPVVPKEKKYSSVILEWAMKPEARPYLEKAYQEYLSDFPKTI